MMEVTLIRRIQRAKMTGAGVKYLPKQQSKQEQSYKQGNKMSELMRLYWPNEGGTKR